ncbi:uncharacterized protein F5Z01DRAFT_224444 [Emericellopsis atlantica]|uniref:Uncharacterized protein n=1 Tax=Emericellopsis atlantica TaxID=2614577 RepID=A0A9P8CMT8_9HYPO|nr:uncharacterized protein F5Z01DRAFT_224444 [Emericellopsis atlantica]KAG9252360.1 hypothetical protein F5Z01DRAFT_224444 [Emericellopsis atlantica]
MVDTINLTSNIGTWLGAAVAIIALVGVVGPYLALRASLSDSNRALNAVKDDSGKYVTRGYRFTRGMRVFRRIRVPDLAPSYISNETTTIPLVAPAATRGPWTIRGRKSYQQFNTSWAKLAELIESYQAHDLDGEAEVDLCVPRGGTLEIVQSQTALVASKYWVLILGLLGRYGNRPDKGVLHRARVRRNRQQELGLKRDIKNDFRTFHPGVRPRRPRTTPVDEGERQYRVLSPVPLPDEPTLGNLTPRSDSDSGSSLYRRPPTIFGITGRIRNSGRQKGSWNYLNLVSFTPHTNKDMFPAKGRPAKRDVVSLETLFWLAQGFLPCGMEADGQRVVISLEDPGDEEEDAVVHGNFSADNLDVSISVFDLQESDDMPRSTGNALRSLGLTEPREPKVLRLLPYDHNSAMMRVLITSIRLTTHRGPRRKRIMNVHQATISFQEAGKRSIWIFPRNALEKPIGLFLSLEWDPWGFVVRRHRFFSMLLSRTTVIMHHSETFLSKTFWESLGMGQIPLGSFRPDVDPSDLKFNAKHLRERIALDNYLSNYLGESTALPLKLSLGALFILDDAFQTWVDRAIRRLQIQESMSFDEVRRENQDNTRGLTEKLNLLKERHATKRAETLGIKSEASLAGDNPSRESSSQSQNESHAPYFSVSVPTFLVEEEFNRTTIDIQQLEEETLADFGVRYELGTQFDEDLELEVQCFVVEGRVPEWEQEILLQHTQILRELRDKIEEAKVVAETSLEYEFSSKWLTWRRGDGNGGKERELSWSLGDELLRVPGPEAKIMCLTIMDRDILVIALWVMNRAAMWIGSLDSKPLLRFVDTLDPYVYVV